MNVHSAPHGARSLDLLASGSEDGTVRVHRIDPATGDATFLASAAAGRGPVHALVSLEGGRIAAGFADGHVIVYLLDVARGTLDAIDLFHAHDGEIYTLAAKDGLLAAAGEDEHAKVFRREGDRYAFLGATAPHDDFVRAAVWLGDGRLATASYDGAIRFFE